MKFIPTIEVGVNEDGVVMSAPESDLFAAPHTLIVTSVGGYTVYEPGDTLPPPAEPVA